MRLPLACFNVIQKVLTLIRCWLLQLEFPPFVDDGSVSLEAWCLLLIRSMMSFFRSPYLISSGEKLPSAVNLTHHILSTIRDLANPSSGITLIRQLPKAVWAELLKALASAVQYCCSRSDAYGSATAAVFTRTLLCACIHIRVIREVDVDEAMWDDVWLVFRGGIWTQMIDQWSRTAHSVTRALVLNLFAIDVSQLGDSSPPGSHDGLSSNAADSASTASSSVRRQVSLFNTRASSENSSVGGVVGYLCNDENENEGVGPMGNGSATAKSHGGDAELAADKGIIQSTGNITNWLRTWMRVMNLLDPRDPRHSQQAVQVYSRAIDLLLRVGCANILCHWLSTRILSLSNISQQPHAIAPLCSVLIKAEPPPLERAFILRHLLASLKQSDDEGISNLVLERLPEMGAEDGAVISKEAVGTLHKLLKCAELSPRAVRVAAILALDHPEAEKVIFSLLDREQSLTGTEILDSHSLGYALNALSLLVLERADANLLGRLIKLIAGHPQSATLWSLLCSNLNCALALGFRAQLAESLISAIEAVGDVDVKCLNDLKWQLCSLSLHEKVCRTWRALIDKLTLGCNDTFLEGLLVQRALQFPLPGFHVSQWNSIQCTTATAGEADGRAFMATDGAILSFDKRDKYSLLWSRSVVGRHCYHAERLTGAAATEDDEECESEDNPVNAWLSSSAAASGSGDRPRPLSSSAASDPFQNLPRPGGSVQPHSANGDCTPHFSGSDQNEHAAELEEMLSFLQAGAGGRTPESSSNEGKWREELRVGAPPAVPAPPNVAWRQLVSDLNLIARAKEVSANFHRELRHLDNTLSREVHKVGVIYVGREQEDKQSILANTTGSLAFNEFVAGLGWEVEVGRGGFGGYAGGLPLGQAAPYYATADAELIFHVSTMLQGDAQQKMKHIGNDEVHVVWSENPTKPYRRDVIATRFCDVLIVLQPISPVLLKVGVEVQDDKLCFGPLFDGACIHVKQAASFVRESVLNASRAYRNLKLECDRPNKHRENVYQQVKGQLAGGHLAGAINRLYAPMLNS